MIAMNDRNPKTKPCAGGDGTATMSGQRRFAINVGFRELRLGCLQRSADRRLLQWKLQASVAHEPREIVRRTWDLAAHRWVRSNDVQITVDDLECAVSLTLACELPIAARFIATAA